MRIGDCMRQCVSELFKWHERDMYRNGDRKKMSVNQSRPFIEIHWFMECRCWKNWRQNNLVTRSHSDAFGQFCEFVQLYFTYNNLIERTVSRNTMRLARTMESSIQWHQSRASRESAAFFFGSTFFPPACVCLFIVKTTRIRENVRARG